jgi:zinc and cadmium transporter
MAITLGTLCLGIVLASVLGGILPLATVLNHTRLQVYLSFSAGTMLGAAFFHMLPEAVRAGSAATIPWAAVGLLVLFFLERFFSFHHHESHHDHSEVDPQERQSRHGALLSPGASPPGEQLNDPARFREGEPPGEPGFEAARTEPRPPRIAKPHLVESTSNSERTSDDRTRAAASNGSALRWGSAAFGLAVHSLVGGVALASAVAADYQVRAGLGVAGLGVFVATLVHKPADALTITSLMMTAGAARREAHALNLGFALMIPLGVALFAVGMAGARQSTVAAWTSGALAFSAGTFLCIALSDVLPELHFHSHDRLKLSIALLAGIVLMAGTAAVEFPGPAPGILAQ